MLKSTMVLMSIISVGMALNSGAEAMNEDHKSGKKIVTRQIILPFQPTNLNHQNVMPYKAWAKQKDLDDKDLKQKYAIAKKAERVKKKNKENENATYSSAEQYLIKKSLNS